MATKTKAFLKIDEYRDYANEDASKIQAKDLSWTVYIYTNHMDKPCAAFYIGRSKKSRRHYYNSIESREYAVKSWIRSQEATAKIRKQRKANSERRLKVGDVLSAMWGYEQTNWSYYLVTKLVGKSSVDVVEIGATRVEDEEYSMTGKCVPNPQDIKSKPMTKRVDGVSINFEYKTASLKKYDESIFNETGVKVYTPDSYTSYH